MIGTKIDPQRLQVQPACRHSADQSPRGTGSGMVVIQRVPVVGGSKLCGASLHLHTELALA